LGSQLLNPQLLLLLLLPRGVLSTQQVVQLFWSIHMLQLLTTTSEADDDSSDIETADLVGFIYNMVQRSLPWLLCSKSGAPISLRRLRHF
jgi:hypothetical protein